MTNIETVKNFKLSVVEHLESIERLISDEDSLAEFAYQAELIEIAFDYLLSRLSHSEKERFSES